MYGFKDLELTQELLMNKLFCSFATKDNLDDRLQEINKQYKIMYGKIFVLESPDSEEYMCTYNIELEGSTSKILGNTILLHRKKESNTLYTINALNTLIKSLNGGVLDTKYIIPWKDYKNSILLTQGDELRRLNTSIYKIINVELEN
jgi:hypothetical protein